MTIEKTSSRRARASRDVPLARLKPRRPWPSLPVANTRRDVFWRTFSRLTPCRRIVTSAFAVAASPSPCSRCNNRACSSVRLIAERSLPLLHKVMRPPSSSRVRAAVTCRSCTFFASGGSTSSRRAFVRSLLCRSSTSEVAKGTASCSEVWAKASNAA
eukprot:scaffold191356_cov28-Tisochrysis_lutea.AAC.3